jgi:hypothetical protein
MSRFQRWNNLSMTRMPKGAKQVVDSHKKPVPPYRDESKAYPSRGLRSGLRYCVLSAL